MANLPPECETISKYGMILHHLQLHVNTYTYAENQQMHTDQICFIV